MNRASLPYRGKLLITKGLVCEGLYYRFVLPVGELMGDKQEYVRSIHAKR